MKIVIPDDYQDTIHKLDAFKLLAGHEVIRSPRSYRSMEEAYTHGSVALAQVRAQRAPASPD